MKISMRKLLLPVMFIAVAAAVIITLQKRSSAAIVWKKDARQMYRIDIRTLIHAAQLSIKQVHRSFEFHGTLNFRIYRIDADRVKAGFQFSNLAIRRGAIEDKAAQSLYSTLFFADFSREGRLLKFYFSNEISPVDERILSDIIQSFQLIVKDTSFGKWTTEEENINGAYEAEYAVNKSSVTKSKKKYIAVTDITGNEAEERIEIKESGMKFEYGEGSWINNAEGRERIVFYSRDKPYLKISTMVKLASIPFAPDGKLAIWDPSVGNEEIIAAWNSRPKNKISLGQKSETDALKKKFGTKTLDDIAGELFKKYRGFNLLCIQELIQFLELHPDAALQFPEYLRNNKLNPTQQIMLVHALERTGSEKAQTALSNIMLGSDFSRESRTQAAIAFGNISKPSDESINSLWEAYEGGSQINDINANTISSAAVLSLGSMARNLGRSKDEEFIGKSDSIKNKIGADLEMEKDLNTTVALLHAAGNTADENMMKNITPYFEDKNPRIRAVAINSLVYMDDTGVYDILTEKLNSENDINVRNAVVNTLYRKEATEEAVNRVIENIPSEENDIVRGSMYRYLLKNRDFPGVKSSLEKMLESETSTEHRKIITKALRTKKPASQGSSGNK